MLMSSAPNPSEPARVLTGQQQLKIQKYKNEKNTKKYKNTNIGTCASTCGTAAVKDTAKSRRVAATSANETQDDAEEEDAGADSPKRGNVEAKAVADQADLVFLRPTLCSTSLGLRSSSLRFF